jgi:hypothetical protein
MNLFMDWHFYCHCLIQITSWIASNNIGDNGNPRVLNSSWGNPIIECCLFSMFNILAESNRPVEFINDGHRFYLPICIFQHDYCKRFWVDNLVNTYFMNEKMDPMKWFILMSTSTGRTTIGRPKVDRTKIGSWQLGATTIGRTVTWSRISINVCSTVSNIRISELFWAGSFY